MADKYINVGGHKVTTDREMEYYTGSLTATNYTVTYEYYKKDKVVTLKVSFKPTAAISAGTSISTSNAIPEKIRPVFSMASFHSSSNSGSGTTYPYQITLNKGGTINIFNFVSMNSGWSAIGAVFTYLIE